MSINRRSILTAGLATASLALPLPASSQSLSPAEAQAIAEDAYIYGYSLLTTEVTRVQMTSVDKVEALRAPMNQFANVPRYPPADYRGVSAPNADTLYSCAFLDLSGEPMLLSYPDMGKRFFLFPIYDAWTNVIHSAGSRTSGQTPQNLLIFGPSWHGPVPRMMTLVPGDVIATGTPAAPGGLDRTASRQRRLGRPLPRSCATQLLEAYKIRRRAGLRVAGSQERQSL